MRVTAPDSAKDRFEVYRFFNGLAVEGKDGLDQGRTRIPLVKTFLVEHVSSKSGRTPKPATDIFHGLGAKVLPIDDTFFGLQAPDDNAETTPKPFVTRGFIEQYSRPPAPKGGRDRLAKSTSAWAPAQAKLTTAMSERER